MKAGIEEFIEGDEYEKGKIIGKYLCDIVTCFIGVVKGVKAGAQLVKELKNTGSLSKLIRAGLNKTAGNLKNSADEIARSIKAAGEAIERLVYSVKYDIDNLASLIKNIIKGDGYTDFVLAADGAPAGESFIYRMADSEVPRTNFGKLQGKSLELGKPTKSTKTLTTAEKGIIGQQKAIDLLKANGEEILDENLWYNVYDEISSTVIKRGEVDILSNKAYYEVKITTGIHLSIQTLMYLFQLSRGFYNNIIADAISSKPNGRTWGITLIFL